MTTTAIIVGLAAWYAFFMHASCWRRHDFDIVRLICRRCGRTREAIIRNG